MEIKILSGGIRAEVAAVREAAHRRGSINYESEIAMGLIPGEPQFSGSTMHHMRVCHDGWQCITMFNPLAEAALTELLRGSESVEIAGCNLRWSEENGTRLLVDRAVGGCVEVTEIPLPESVVLSLGEGFERPNGVWDYSGCVIGRR